MIGRLVSVAIGAPTFISRMNGHEWKGNWTTRSLGDNNYHHGYQPLTYREYKAYDEWHQSKQCTPPVIHGKSIKKLPYIYSTLLDSPKNRYIISCNFMTPAIHFGESNGWKWKFYESFKKIAGGDKNGLQQRRIFVWGWGPFKGTRTLQGVTGTKNIPIIQG